MMLSDNAHAAIEYDERHDLLVLSWKKYTSNQIFREIVLAYYEILEKKNVQKCVIDCRLLKTIHAEDQLWAARLVNENMSMLKSKQFAVVMPDNLHTHYAIRNIAAGVISDSDPAKLPCFGSIEEAKKWLLTNEKSIGNLSAEFQQDYEVSS